MALGRGLVRSAIPWKQCVSNTRQFSSFFKPNTPRITTPILSKEFPQELFVVPRRSLFGRKKKSAELSSDSVTEKAKSFGQICYRFTIYSGVFIIIAVAGFFVYDVHLMCPYVDLGPNLPSQGTAEGSTNSVSVR